MKRVTPLLVLGLLTIALMGSMAYYLRDLSPPLLAAQLTFSRQAFESVLSHWSIEQVQRFSRHFTVDYVFLVIYGTFGWLLGRQLIAFRRVAGYSSRLLPWFLPSAAVLDCTENFLHQAFLSQPSGISESLYFAAGLAASGKWALTFIFLVLAVHAWRQNAA